MSVSSASSAHALIPEVQGLRAFSVIAVVLFHMGWLWCGWMGVWVFFVISGFVITRSLATGEPAPWRVRLKRFYLARTGRILPLYLVAILVAVATLCVQAWLYDQPDEFRFLNDLPWLLTGLYNLRRAFPDYEQTQLFGHFWSLAVEEQFYAFFPIAFLLLSRKRLATLLVVLVASGPLIRIGCHLALGALGWTGPEAAKAVYQLSFNHFDAFAAGCLIAVWEPRIRELRETVAGRRIAWMAPCGVAALGVACIIAQAIADGGLGRGTLINPFVVTPQTLAGQVLTYAFANAVAVCALLWVLLGVPVSVFLRRRWLVQVGTLSFGIYIWHYPLLWLFAQAGGRSWEGAVAYWIAVWAVSAMSYAWLEQPAMAWIRSSGWRRLGLTDGSPTSAAQSPVRP